MLAFAYINFLNALKDSKHLLHETRQSSS